jgi:hypothetical protein
MLGGHYGGRYLEDLWVYDLNSLQWSQAQASAAPGQEEAPPPPPPPAKGKAKGRGRGEEEAPLLAGAVPPPSAGHSVTTWGERLLVLGGHTKVRALRPVERGGEARHLLPAAGGRGTSCWK